jgi:hypothetical protein
MTSNIESKSQTSDNSSKKNSNLTNGTRIAREGYRILTLSRCVRRIRIVGGLLVATLVLYSAVMIGEHLKKASGVEKGKQDSAFPYTLACRLCAAASAAGGALTVTLLAIRIRRNIFIFGLILAILFAVAVLADSGGLIIHISRGNWTWVSILFFPAAVLIIIESAFMVWLNGMCWKLMSV